MGGLAAVGLALIGVWLLVLSIGGTVSTLGSMAFMAALDSSINSGTLFSVSLLALMGYLALGVLLIANRHRLATRLFADQQLNVSVRGDQALRSSCGTPYDPEEYRPDAVALCVQCGEPVDLWKS